MIHDMEFPVSGIRSTLQLKSCPTPAVIRSSPLITYYSDKDNSNEKVSFPTSLKRKHAARHPGAFETNHLRLCIKEGIEMVAQASKRLKIRIPAQKASKQDDNHLGESSRVNIDALPPTASSSCAEPQKLKGGSTQNLKITLTRTVTKRPKSKRRLPLGVDGPKTASSSASQALPATSHFKIKIPPLRRPDHRDQNDNIVATTTPNAMEPPSQVVSTYPRRIAPLPKRYRQ